MPMQNETFSFDVSNGDIKAEAFILHWHLKLQMLFCEAITTSELAEPLLGVMHTRYTGSLVHDTVLPAAGKLTVLPLLAAAGVG